MKDLIKKIIPDFLIGWYHFLLAFIGAVIYRFPSMKLKVIGITGTNGKTTVVEMVTKILEITGYRVTSLSSIKFKVGKTEWPNTLRMTMPGRFFVQRFLRQAVNSGCQYAVLEVTSEGIKQYRHRFIDFEVAVFTNLTPEHIEAHGSFENYKKAKGKLFEEAKNTHIINLDDANAEYFFQFPAKEKIGFTTSEKDRGRVSTNLIYRGLSSVIKAEDIGVLSSGLKFFVNNKEFNLKLLGEFNICNALAAICIGLSQGIDLETCKAALEKIKEMPGRMELIIKKPFKVIVDYAFTPSALRKVYETLLKSKIKNQKSKMICVLGAAGGGRDKWKRPVLGELASQYCDQIILTNEDPYDEDEFQIISQIESGITAEKKLVTEIILDRRRAIKESLKFAKSNDVLVITGKGCEPSICVAGGKKIPWDDRKVVKEEFEKIYKNSNLKKE